MLTINNNVVHVCMQFNRSEANPFEVKWQNFAWAFYVKHMGLKMPKPKNIPPKRYHLRFTEILGLLFIHELLSRTHS